MVNWGITDLGKGGIGEPKVWALGNRGIGAWAIEELGGMADGLAQVSLS